MNNGSVFPPVPADTAQAARNAIASGEAYFILSQEMASLYALCPRSEGEVTSEEDPVVFMRHAVVTVLQEAEAMTDRCAERATRSSLNWSYALHLPLNASGIPAHELCLFRQKLFSNAAAHAAFQAIREDVMGLQLWPNLLRREGEGRDGISYVCRLNQTAWFVEALGRALEAIASYSPDLLRRLALPHWYTQYATDLSDELAIASSSDVESAYQAVMKDISHLLTGLALYSDEEPGRLPEVRRLRRSWQLDCERCDLRDRACVFCDKCVVGVDIARWHA